MYVSPLGVQSAGSMLFPPNSVSDLKIEIINEIDQDLSEKIGRFRLQIYRKESVVNEDLIPDGIWLDPEDAMGTHAVIRNVDGSILAAARLSIHPTLAEAPEGELWINARRHLQEPIAHLGKFVVDEKCQKQGVGTLVCTSLMTIARERGARSVILSTSEKMVASLTKRGFVDTGIRATFPKSRRPYESFACLEYIL